MASGCRRVCWGTQGDTNLKPKWQICIGPSVFIHWTQTAVYMFCEWSMLEGTVWPFPLTSPCVSRLQQWAEGSCQCRIIKTSVEVTGSLGGMQHSKAPLLSCFLCELSRPLRIYSSMAQHSPSPLPLHLPDRCHLQATISGAKHNAFSSLTSHTHRQSTEQQESEDNINVASFTLT